MACCILTGLGTPHLKLASPHANFISPESVVRLCNFSYNRHHRHSVVSNRSSGRRIGIYCSSKGSEKPNSQSETTGIQLYRDIERVLTETVKQSQDGLGGSGDWSEIEGAWVLRPRNSKLTSIVHFVGGIFVGAAPQLTYRLFLERLADKGVLIIATPYASGFDHFLIADEVQFKFERCLRYLRETEASHAIPLFSPVLVPMAQSIGPFLSQIASSPTIRLGAEMTRKQFENLSPSILKQVLPLVEQLPPLYMDLAKGREDFSPKPEETRRLIRSYYGISRNLLIKFKDDTIDETPTLAQVLSSESAISSMLDMSIRSLPGDHGLPLQQVLPDVPPSMADAVNRGGEFLATLTAGTPWETVAKEVGSTFGADSRIFRAENPKEIDLLVDVITRWIASNAGPRLLRP
ncbi:hypothetical protein DH2020_027161 [Rehmannia glutinosa]|uniref:Uncharacterized protein n=1 Tax=Rehmannia glutinosa TaxID=99300 RepID=A0ABR0VUY9_REHGL